MMRIYRAVIIVCCALILAACGAANSAVSPAATLNNFVEASKNKDVETIKKLLSKGSMEAVEKVAAAKNTTVDKILVNNVGASLKELPETRNEKIEGDTASIEVKNKILDSYETIPFVKEDGVWKIALDKFMQNMSAKQPLPAVAPAVPSNGETNKSAANK